MPAKGTTHDWGDKISASMKGRPSVNKGKRGPDAPNWKGGQHTDKDGRVKVWDPVKKRYYNRAILVWMAAHPGETLGPGYVIHHKDEDKQNDVPENLEKLSLAEHAARHRRNLEGYIQVLQGLLDEAGIPYPSVRG
jgi:hypothetical protein